MPLWSFMQLIRGKIAVAGEHDIVAGGWERRLNAGDGLEGR